ncbi:MAG: FHA domain-containing protein [Granulosicoccus sp.]|nr:FHA domain-containing protein [Granulosicoccus sp.]
MTTIIVTHEGNEVDEFVFDAGQGTISIGRRSSNDVCIPDLSVSGNHARITVDADSIWLEDLNSTNGTYVNGEPVKRQTIVDSDEIVIGKIRLTCLSGNVSAYTAGAPAETAAAVTVNSDFGDGHHEAMDEIDPLSMNQSSSGIDDDSGTSTPLPMESAEPAQTAAGSTAFADGSAESAQTGAGSTPHPLDGVDPLSATHGVTASGESASESASESAGDSASDSASDSTSKSASDFPSRSAGESPGASVMAAAAVANSATAQSAMHELDSNPSTSKGAVIEIKNGAKSGQILPIDKPVTTLGRPGIQIAAIMRKPDGYFLMHIESDDSVDRPTLNHDSIGDEPVLLHSGDELNVAGIDVEFMLS